MTDSGGQGALIVVDLAAGNARRVLAAHPTVQAERDVVVRHHGRAIRRPDGRGVEFAADGIELSRDGATLYWQALTGRTLHSIATEALHDASLDDATLGAKVERVGENGVADGLWIDGRGRMYISALEEDAIKLREGGSVTTLLQDERLRWPDTFSEGPDGWVYVTASRIMDNAWHDPDAPRALPTTLFRFRPQDEAPARAH
jgi:sugar lactone lactonase YvrE